MIRALLATFLLAVPLAAEAPPPKQLGVYSNIVYTGEHAKGVAVELWEIDGQTAGFFYSAAGLKEDIPLGQLENVRFDPTGKTLSFKAKLSIGKATFDGETWVPTRDLYQFEGTLFPTELNGELLHTDRLYPDRPVTHERVKLYRDAEWEARMAQPASQREWLEQARIRLQARGPKW